MLIVNDLGTDIVNLEEVFSCSIGTTADGMTVLIAYSAGGVNCPLAAVGDRPVRALELIVKAHKEGWKILDLHDLLGERPKLAVAKQALIVPNGQG
jgi:hypothetical protein